MTAQSRKRLRSLGGGLLISLGTAMFAGAVSLFLDAIAKDTALRWTYLTGFVLLGLALSGSGSWLLSATRSGVGLSVAATDTEGDPGRYQSNAESFAQYGASRFVFHTSIQVPVTTPTDLRELHSRLDAALHTLSRAEPGSRTTGLLFTGRHEVGFHLGSRLRPTNRRVDLYHYSDGTGDPYFPAVRLTVSLSAQPSPLSLRLFTGTGLDPVTLDDLTGRLTPGACLALAVNLIGPPGNQDFSSQVLRSAQAEGASAVVIAEHPPGSDEQVQPSTEAFESTVTAIAKVAAAMPAAPGLLYLRTPAVIAVALGRYLYGASWIPMRHNRTAFTYERFASPSP